MQNKQHTRGKCKEIEESSAASLTRKKKERLPQTLAEVVQIIRFKNQSLVEMLSNENGHLLNISVSSYLTRKDHTMKYNGSIIYMESCMKKQTV